MSENLKVYKTRSMMWVILFPTIFLISDLISGDKKLLEILLVWVIVTGLFTIVLGYTTIIKRVELSDTEARIVYLLRTKIAKMEEAKYYEDNGKNIIVRRETGTILFMVSRKLVLPEDYNSFVTEIKSRVKPKC